MNYLISSLKEICAGYPLREKVLIVPGYGQGRELCEALARSGVGWVNLRPETTAGLAYQIAGGELAEKEITLLTSLLTTAVVEEVFHNLEEQKALRYFARENSAPGLVRAIASSIYELRDCGVSGNCLSASSFVSKDKGHDLVVLLKAYERHLADYKYIDTPGLLSLALKLLSSRTPTADNDAVYLLPPKMMEDLFSIQKTIFIQWKRLAYCIFILFIFILFLMGTVEQLVHFPICIYCIKVMIFLSFFQYQRLLRIRKESTTKRFKKSKIMRAI